MILCDECKGKCCVNLSALTEDRPLQKSDLREDAWATLCSQCRELAYAQSGESEIQS